MLRYVLIFALLAIVAGALGFGGIATGFAALAQIAFVLFFVAALVALVSHAVQGDVV